ncbi:lysozyme 3-like [Amphiura filiformis]|uniref:lysozyme 3-like n=1 Tax=Amphiura filiformis TaxID=82378 RepID=UPI003B22764C
MYLIQGLVLGILLWCAHLGESCFPVHPTSPPPTSSPKAEITAECLQCICKVESICNLEIGCDSAVEPEKCGPYQLTEAYWEAGGSHGEDWRSCAQDKTCAEDTIKCYLGQHDIFDSPTCEDWARFYHGGPDGMNSASADTYWNRVRAQGCSELN